MMHNHIRQFAPQAPTQARPAMLARPTPPRAAVLPPLQAKAVQHGAAMARAVPAPFKAPGGLVQAKQAAHRTPFNPPAPPLQAKHPAQRTLFNPPAPPLLAKHPTQRTPFNPPAPPLQAKYPAQRTPFNPPTPPLQAKHPAQRTPFNPPAPPLQAKYSAQRPPFGPPAALVQAKKPPHRPPPPARPPQSLASAAARAMPLTPAAPVIQAHAAAHRLFPAPSAAPRPPARALPGPPAARAFPSLVQTLQLSRKRKRDDDSDDEDDGDYLPPPTKQPRWTFSARLRADVIRQTAGLHVRGHYYCPACGRPIATTHARELPFTYTSRNDNAHTLTSVTLDHHPAWAPRLAGLRSRKATMAEIREDYLDPTRLRALCKTCNESHRYEGRRIKRRDDDEDYFTDDDEPEMKGKYLPFRGPPPPPPPTGGAGITV